MIAIILAGIGPKTCHNVIVLLWLIFSVKSVVSFDEGAVPKFTDTDSIEVYHLRSFPLPLIDSAAGHFSIQSSGLALRSKTSSVVAVFEYKPVNFSSCFLPRMIDVNGDVIVKGSLEAGVELIWDKGADVNIQWTLNMEYWQHSTFLSRMNGIAYKKFVSWVADFARRNTVFVPQSLCSSEQDAICFSIHQTWDTFIAESFEVLAMLSVAIDAIIPPRATETRILTSSEPEDVVLKGSSTSTVTSTMASLKTVSRTLSNTSSDDMLAIRSSETLPAVDAMREEAVINLEYVRKQALEQEQSEGQKQELPNSLSTHTSHTIDTIDTTDDTGDTAILHWRQRQLRELHLRAHERASARVMSRSRSEVSNSLVSSASASASASTAATHSADSPGSRVSNRQETKTAASTVVAPQKVLDFYNGMFSCLEAYDTQDFFKSLGACMYEGDGYIHITDQRYYKIRLHQPYLYVHDYQQAIHDPQYATAPDSDAADITIGIFFLAMLVSGILASMWKLSVFDLLFGRIAKYRRKKQSTKMRTLEGGGFHSQQVSELPMNRFFGSRNMWAPSPRNSSISRSRSSSNGENGSSGSRLEARRGSIFTRKDSDNDIGKLLRSRSDSDDNADAVILQQKRIKAQRARVDDENKISGGGVDTAPPTPGASRNINNDNNRSSSARPISFSATFSPFPPSPPSPSPTSSPSPEIAHTNGGKYSGSATGTGSGSTAAVSAAGFATVISANIDRYHGRNGRRSDRIDCSSSHTNSNGSNSTSSNSSSSSTNAIINGTNSGSNSGSNGGSISGSHPLVLPAAHATSGSSYTSLEEVGKAVAASSGSVPTGLNSTNGRRVKIDNKRSGAGSAAAAAVATASAAAPLGSVSDTMSIV